METMTVSKLDKEFKVEILKGKPKHSDIKKLLKSDFNFIKGICEVYVLESYHKTANVKILLTDGFIINSMLNTGKGKNMVDEINSLAITAIRQVFQFWFFLYSRRYDILSNLKILMPIKLVQHYLLFLSNWKPR